MSYASAEACTQRLAAGRGTGIGLQYIGLQHVNDEQSAQRDKPLDGSRAEASITLYDRFRMLYGRAMSAVSFVRTAAGNSAGHSDAAPLIVSDA